MINKIKLVFILCGVDQTKIKQSEKSSTYNGFYQNLISTKENRALLIINFSAILLSTK